MSVTQMARRLANGEITSSALVASCLERIERLDSEIRAFAAIDVGYAMAQAAACDAAERRVSPLHGIPVGIKDVLDTGDLPTAYGSPIYRGHRPKMDAASVAALRRAGAVILGKTHTAEFASIHPAETRNPLNPAHTPGGSSSGSAASVAADMVPLALGTQTGGSIIRPAAYCGIVGFKPSYGVVNRVGLKPSAESFDTIGAMACDVDGVALMFRALVQTPPFAAFDSRLQGETLRIGVCETDLADCAAPDAHRALHQATAQLREAGYLCEVAALPMSYSRMNKIGGLIIRYEVARALIAERMASLEDLSGVLRGRLEEGEAIDYVDYVEALRAVAEARREFDRFMTPWDALLTFSTTGEAPCGLQSTGDATFNSVWTLLGIPCLTLPFGRGKNALPLGIQLIGRRYEDERLLAIARKCEERLNDTATRD